MPIWISPRIQRKLAERHRVTEDEIRQCFMNIEGDYLRDTREEHGTDPPSYWFISETNRRRKLKIVFVASKIETPNGAQTRIAIKTAYEPAPEELELYDRRGKC
jgi:hypothetical protein